MAVNIKRLIHLKFSVILLLCSFVCFDFYWWFNVLVCCVWCHLVTWHLLNQESQFKGPLLYCFSLISHSCHFLQLTLKQEPVAIQISTNHYYFTNAWWFLKLWPICCSEASLSLSTLVFVIPSHKIWQVINIFSSN